MGKANRERRRMKEKARKRSFADRTGRASGGFDGRSGAFAGASTGHVHDPQQTVQERVSALVAESFHALDCGDHATVRRLVSALTTGSGPSWQNTVEGTLESYLTSILSSLWQHGWQPADVVRVAGRRLSPAHQVLLHAGIAAGLATYAPLTVDPRWAAQLAEAEIEIWWPAELTAVQACARSDPDGRAAFLTRAFDLLHLLARLPAVQILGPVPGTAVPTVSAPRTSADERILARVRALLAKAESTTYPAEAETFTAGAQALMARHSIDHALLAATDRRQADQPVGRRIGIDNPYEAPKANLLDAIGAANRCRTIWSKELGFCTVVGHAADLDSVELLFTSLLVQGITAMTREGSRTDGIGRSRTRTFRQSFLLAFARRIRERLAEATREQTEAAAAEPGGGNLLPVLASREDAVRQATDELFPHVTFKSVASTLDREGWASGRAAADLASLATASAVTA
jgi:hypothetical protein